ncbi:MAG TPA: hypothetical protein VF572_01190 [Candidatus Saccharimonadales bacterium]|jgi:hypothetical protein
MTEPTQHSSKRKKVIIALLALTLLIVLGSWYAQRSRIASIKSYDACVKEKTSLTELSYPAKCVLRDGRSFVQPT